ncbi:MAG: ATP-binding protein [Patescibacteria group bacterium]
MGLDFLNVDLLALGISIAAIGILGFVVFLQNPKSATHFAFLFTAVMTACYGVANYVNYQVSDPVAILWLIRIVIFFAVWHAFSFFHLFFVFPEIRVRYPVWYRLALIPAVTAVSILTLTPFVFTKLSKIGGIGEVSTPEIGIAAPVFFATIAFLILAGIYLLLKRTFRTNPQERKRFIYVLIGSVLSFGLLLILNLIFPILFNSVVFVPFAGLTFLPFIFFTGYAVIRYKLLDVKVLSTEIVALALSIVAFVQIIFAQTLLEKVFTSGVFLLVLLFSFMLIKGVTNEVKQREEIEHLADNLRVANDKLKELDRLKSQFLSMASHDLRAPLTIIRNFISLLLDGSYGVLAPAGKEGLQQVFDRATDMAKSVETYLDVSRIEQGRMKYDFIDIELLPLVKNAVTAFTPNAEKKGLKLTATYDSALEGAKAKIDVSKMNEVLNNLLDNTIKYTPTGTMNLSLKRIGDASSGPKGPSVVRLTLKDTGVGMSADTLKNLFQLFRPGEDSKRINPASTGVGLFVTKAHVEAHKGKVWAESEGVGKGSTFIMELPLLTA